jgi:hypothetical protein
MDRLHRPQVTLPSTRDMRATRRFEAHIPNYMRCVQAESNGRMQGKAVRHHTSSISSRSSQFSSHCGTVVARRKRSISELFQHSLGHSFKWCRFQGAASIHRAMPGCDTLPFTVT